MIVKLVASTEVHDWDFGYISHWDLFHPDGECVDEPEEFLYGVVEDDQGSVRIEANPAWDAWYQANIPTSADELGEAAGRLCYLSWDRPNPATASNQGYLANIIKQQHFSVLEHASATFYLGSVSRSFTHELVRHRHLSFSQVSQRYVDEGGDNQDTVARSVTPPALRGDSDVMMVNQILEGHLQARRLYRTIYSSLIEKGLGRKQAREAARSVLPNSTSTQILVTGNFRAWRDVLQKRLSPGADAEFQMVAKAILRELLKIAPNSFQDLEGLSHES